jgi:uncharacterized repeat protein (TIGR01451 family)
MNFPKKEESAIDSIEHELYDPRRKVNENEMHHTRPQRSLDLPTSWGDDSSIITKGQEEKGLSFGTKLLLVAILCLAGAIGLFFWKMVSLRNVVSSSNIDMTVDVTPFIEGGEATPLIVTLRNRNAIPLEGASVTLLYKQGNGSQDEQEKIQEKRDIGSIKSNEEYKKQDFSVVLYGSEGDTRDIVLKLEYKVAGSAATFNKLVSAHVILKAPPISVHLDAPERLSVGQVGTFTCTVKNNSATTSLPSILTLTLPNSLTITETSPKPITRSSSWNIESLPPGESKVITFSGSFAGKQGEVATIQSKIGSQGDSPTSIGVVYASETKDIAIQDSPLTLSIDLLTDHGGTEFIKYGDRATYTINYTNTSKEALSDVSIKMNIAGDAAIYDSIDPTSGYYDSLNKVIVWDKASLPDLAVLAPNSQGSLHVVIPVVMKGDNSPTIKITLVGSAGVNETEMKTTLAKTWGIQGAATLEAGTQYKNSPLQNSGPIPPEANKETTYSVHMSVSAQNVLSYARASFTLPAYVTWKGTASNPSAVSYDSRTRTVVWDAGKLEQGAVSAIDIQLGVKPSQSHVGSSPVITSGIIFDAEEEVSRARTRVNRSPLTTVIRNEEWTQNPSVVVNSH